MTGYFLASLAERDIDEIWLYISSESVVAADRMVDRFAECFERLVRAPYSGERLTVRSRQNLRRAIVSPYVVVYQLVDDQVCIVRILHAARRWEELL